jgi:hypothetical protein
VSCGSGLFGVAGFSIAGLIESTGQVKNAKVAFGLQRSADRTGSQAMRGPIDGGARLAPARV